MPVISANDVQPQIVEAGDKTTIQVLISSQEGPNFAMRRFVMQPGGGIPNPTNTVEHEKYMLRGHARIVIGGQEYEVKARDVVFIPEGVPHWYQNDGEEDFEFLCMIPNKPDEIRIEDEKGC